MEQHFRYMIHFQISDCRFFVFLTHAAFDAPKPGRNFLKVNLNFLMHLAHPNKQFDSKTSNVTQFFPEKNVSIVQIDNFCEMALMRRRSTC